MEAMKRAVPRMLLVFAVFLILWYLLPPERAGIALRIACAALAWLFVVRYATLRWDRTEEGRHLMGFTLIVAIFMTLASVVVVFGQIPYIRQIAVLLYTWLLYLLVMRNYLLHVRQKERRAEDVAKTKRIKDEEDKVRQEE